MTMPASVRVEAAAADRPVVRSITGDDISAALRDGWRDFQDNPTHYLFMALIFPAIGLALILAFAGVNLLPLVFPAVAGFALVGPFAALGIYEMSRQREQGHAPTLSDAMAVLHSPAIGSVAVMGLLLCAIFTLWMAIAYVIYGAVVGPYEPLSANDFLRNVVGTPKGWALIVVGNIVGFVFAVAALAISVVSFPLLLDRNTDVATAIRTSVAAVRENPGAMARWGLTVAVLLFLGALPALVGLAVVVPLLGHATWHLYRRVVR